MSAGDAVNKWSKKVRNLLDRTQQKFVAEAFYGLIRRSPIKTGRYRASHRIGVDAMDTSVEPVRTTLSTLSIGAAPTSEEVTYLSAMLKKVKFGTRVILSNSLVYAKKLEAGSSAQNNNKYDGIYGDTSREVARRAPWHIATVREGGAGSTDIAISRT